MFVDSHAHLGDAAFDADRDDVIARAKANGCCAIVCIGASIADALLAANIAKQHAGFVYSTAGVHPHDAAGYDAARDEPAIRSAIANGAVAVGECGLDYHYDHSPRDAQLSVFAAQMFIARDTGRPLVVHTREADGDTRACVRECGESGVRGVLHCFSGGPALADDALAAGWYVSFSGVITFKKWNDDALIRMIPDDRLLAETDAPYLTPVPFRGTRNEPAHVALIVEKLARARGQTPEHVGKLVTENAARCFRLVLPEKIP